MKINSRFPHLNTPVPIIAPKAQAELRLSQFAVIEGYKYLHKADIDYWNSGSIMIDPLSSYAAQDDYTKVTEGRGDSNELSLLFGTIETGNPLENNLEILHENLRVLGLGDYRTAINATIQDVTHKLKNRHVFCMSNRFSHKAFNRWHDVEGYDAVIRIPDVLKFAHSISRADQLSRKLLNFSPYLNWIHYISLPINTEDLSNTRLFPDMIFFKDKAKFNWQNEIRLSWALGKNDDEVLPNNSKRYNLIIPELTQLFEIHKILD